MKLTPTLFINPGKNQKGIIIDYILVFGAIFLMLLSGLLGFILLQLRSANVKVDWNEALNIAEGGMNYYRWCLNNNAESHCGGQHNYRDSEGQIIGQFNITSVSVNFCGLPAQRKITISGWMSQTPDVKRTISVTYAQPSVAQYSYILNSNVWVGNDHIVRGPYHSNGGIRMDGSNQSLMSSSQIYNGQAEWICDDHFGCGSCPTAQGQCRISGGNCLCPSIFTTTANPNSSLFRFPIPQFDFNALTIDLATIKDKAQHAGGIYLPKSTVYSASGKGYHLKFQNNGSVQIWIVTATTPTSACINDCSVPSDDTFDYTKIATGGEYFFSTQAIPADCSAIFAEDNIWIEGLISGKVAVASANLVDNNVDTDAVLTSSITYVHNDGTDGLSLIAERNILISPLSPDNMELDGIFTAQKGHFGRNHYYNNNKKSSLVIYGSVVSSGRVGTKWTSGTTFLSGYNQRETYYDQAQVKNPPPFIGHISPDYKIVSWQEIE